MSWISQNAIWLFDGLGSLIVVGVVGWVVKRFFTAKHKSASGEVAASGNASVGASPVASGSNISQTVNSPTLNVILPPQSSVTLPPKRYKEGRDLSQENFPERGDYHRSTSLSRTNPDGSITFEATVARQIDRRPQLWEALSGRFKELDRKPVPIWGEWIYTVETKQYQWWVRHSSEIAVKLCIELCKEAGRLLLAEPSFRTKFPDIAAVTDDGDRWILGIYKIAGIGKVRGTGSSASHGTVTTSENGEIKDLPGASQVLCHMAMNGI